MRSRKQSGIYTIHKKDNRHFKIRIQQFSDKSTNRGQTGVLHHCVMFGILLLRHFCSLDIVR